MWEYHHIIQYSYMNLNKRIEVSSSLKGDRGQNYLETQEKLFNLWFSVEN